MIHTIDGIIRLGDEMTALYDGRLLDVAAQAVAAAQAVGATHICAASPAAIPIAAGADMLGVPGFYLREDTMEPDEGVPLPPDGAPILVAGLDADSVSTASAHCGRWRVAGTHLASVRRRSTCAGEATCVERR